MNDTSDYNLRYHDRVSAKQLETLFSGGPAFYNVATPFLTSRNADLTLWLEGDDGVVWRSTDGGNWWFSTIYNPRKIDTFKTTGFRLNRSDPWIYRGAVHRVARMIKPGSLAYTWPEDLSSVAESSNLLSYTILSPKQAFDAGFEMKTYRHTVIDNPKLDSDLPSGISNFSHWPHGDFSFSSSPSWVYPPVDPGREPSRHDFDETTAGEAAGQSAFDSAHATWQSSKNAYDAALASYNLWKQSVPLYGIKRHGKVTHLLSIRATGTEDNFSIYTHVGLVPFYHREKFLGWGAVKIDGVALPYGTGIMESLSTWSTEYASEWVPIEHETFDPMKDPQL